MEKLSDIKLSVANVQDQYNSLAYDLVAYFKVIEDMTNDLLEKAINEGWDPERMISEIQNLFNKEDLKSLEDETEDLKNANA
jgi:hypothetical protein